MKGKNLLILSIVLLVLVGAAHFSRKRNSSTNVEVDAGSAIFDQLNVNAVAKIVVRSATQLITYEKSEGKWVSPDNYMYPVDFERVKRLVRGIADLESGQLIRGGESQLADLMLVDPEAETMSDPRLAGTRVVLADDKGEIMVELRLGKMHQGGDTTGSLTPDEKGFAGKSDGRYVLVGDKVYLVADLLSDVPFMSKDWLKDDVASVFSGDIAEVLVEGEDRDPVHLLRGEDGEMHLQGLGDDEIEHGTKIRNLAAALSYMKFDQLADPDSDEEVTGFADGATYMARKNSGVTYRVTIGRETDDEHHRYMKMAVSYFSVEPPALPDESEADLAARKTREEKLAADATAENERASKWIFLLSDHTAQTLIIERAELLKQQDDEE